jgi:hypothetical protein
VARWVCHSRWSDLLPSGVVFSSSSSVNWPGAHSSFIAVIGASHAILTLLLQGSLPVLPVVGHFKSSNGGFAQGPQWDAPSGDVIPPRSQERIGPFPLGASSPKYFK